MPKIDKKGSWVLDARKVENETAQKALKSEFKKNGDIPGDTTTKGSLVGSKDQS